jgi:hypothetical protein
MTDDLLSAFRSAVPLPDEKARQRVYARATGRRGRTPARRRQVVVLAAAVAASASVSTVAVTGSLHGSRSRPAVRRGLPSFLPISLTFTRDAGTITAIAVTVNSSLADALMQLQVRRSEASQLPVANNADSQVVFQEQVPLSGVSAPPSGPAGSVILSTWSGSLSPNDWDGGCESALYSIRAVVVPVGGSFADPGPGSSQMDSAWFSCT